MSMNIDQIAESFSKHGFAATYSSMADDIKWNIVGGQELVGRDAVIGMCEQSAAYLATVATTFMQFKVTRAEFCVVVESVAQYKDAEDQISSVASCDIYQFSGERLVEITSYNIELNKS